MNKYSIEDPVDGIVVYLIFNGFVTQSTTFNNGLAFTFEAGTITETVTATYSSNVIYDESVFEINI